MLATLCIVVLVLPSMVISRSLHPGTVYHFLSPATLAFAILNLGILALATFRRVLSASRLALVSAGCSFALQLLSLFSIDATLLWKLWYWLLAGSNFALLIVAASGIAKQQTPKPGLRTN